jgi:hypothetical protein
MLFPSTKINAPIIYHESFSPKFSYAKKKYRAMLKKERCMKLSNYQKKKRRKNGTHEGSKVLKKRER